MIATRGGQSGFVASEYIWTHLPEPCARLHRVESGLPGTAIAIAEAYYGDLAAQWGEDLRFVVNVLAHVNRLPVPPSTTGWREVRFRHDTLIWIPSRRYAQSLSGVVNSGSFSYNLATTVGSTVARVTQLWDDFHRAIALSSRYLGEAVTPFHKFIGTVWNARGNAAAVDRAAREFAEAIATLISVIMEGLLMLAMSRGVVLDGESAARNSPRSQDRRSSVGGMAQPAHRCLSRSACGTSAGSPGSSFSKGG